MGKSPKIKTFKKKKKKRCVHFVAVRCSSIASKVICQSTTPQNIILITLRHLAEDTNFDTTQEQKKDDGSLNKINTYRYSAILGR